MPLSNQTKTDITNIYNLGTPYLALYTSSPNATDTSGTEVTGGSYARQSITFGPVNTTTGEMKNTNAISFANMPTAAVTYYAIRSAATGGVLREWGLLSQSVLSGDEIVIGVGSIVTTVAGS